MTTHDRLRSFARLIPLFSALFWGACDFNGQVSGDLRTLRLQIPHEPATLDTSLAEDGASFRFFSAFMKGLVDYDANYQIHLAIADKMESLEGGRRYRFHLRDWAWSDGKKVDAADFVFAMRRTLSPENNAKLADLLFFIRGARDFKRGKLADFSKVGISAPSAQVLEFQLERPTSFFPHVLTLSVGLPQRADLFEKYGARWPEHAEATGPFRLARWERDRVVEMDRNPHYPRELYSADAPERLRFQVVPDESSALTLFEQKRVDVLFKVPSYDLTKLRQKNAVREYPYFATYYLGFDQRQLPWSQRSARLAVAHAIDRGAIVSALGERHRAATSWIPYGFAGHAPKLGIGFDPAQARSEWKKSSQAPRSVSLGFDNGSRNQTVLERVQSDLKTSLSIQVKLVPRDWKTYLNELSTAPQPIFRFGWLCPFVDPYAALMLFESTNPNNYTGWKSKTYDSLLAQIAALPEGVKRASAVEAAQRMLVEEAIVVPLFHYQQELVVSERIDALPVNGFGVVDYARVSLKK